MSRFNSSAALANYSYDSYSNIFEPEVVLPSQFFGEVEAGLGGGERKLMAALLSDGVEAYLSQAVAIAEGRREKSDAREWVETIDKSYVFSFDNVCECLGINPDYLRLGLSRYVQSISEQRLAGDAKKVVWKRIRRPRK